ncbi:MAG: diaminopimelate epimerase [Bacteroidetes bacterium]|nr:MAG: diaminopimelate epimerase [Bacteroidota bacterium]
MKFSFHKYQGTGNDFVMVDHREGGLSHLSQEQIALICHRRFGIGADGFILIEDDPNADFKMVYYNSDGRESTMCGNGGRCSVRFARFLGIGKDEHITFTAIDGLHEASVADGIVSLGMNDVREIRDSNGDWFLDTGSPHHVCFVENVEDFPVDKEGRRIRNEVYGVEGSNVNFIEWDSETLHVRTYERGVEGETYSCGTGVTASALALHHSGISSAQNIQIKTPGGNLSVSFTFENNAYHNVKLVGPAQFVFAGVWER